VSDPAALSLPHLIILCEKDKWTFRRNELLSYVTSHDVNVVYTPQRRRVVANILKGPLVELAPRLAAYARPGALLGLSGILKMQAPEILEAYGPVFEDFEVQEEEGWALITATRRGS